MVPNLIWVQNLNLKSVLYFPRYRSTVGALDSVSGISKPLKATPLPTNLKCFDEPKGADSPSSGHQAESGIRQQLVEIPPGKEERVERANEGKCCFVSDHEEH